MKKIIIVLTFLSNLAFGQITISGASTSGLNQTFQFSSVAAFNSACASGITPHDAGTNIYSVNDPSISSLRYTIARRGGIWHIEGHYGGGGYVVYYKLPTSSTDINPPCSAVWNIYTGNCYYGNSITNTGTTASLTLTGSCSSMIPSQSGQITPNFFLLPQLTTSQINSTPSPKKGMVVFDINSNNIKVFNGAVWDSLKTL